ncbi:D-glycero-alpha-D-manno-heptose-1,7-bisphosphate 7-phosphatase [Sphingomonas profundi]|uniref:D-glycero-alpha-D-manno-heptose-1,7-bisphosphate 7-phosphatase n=1 Tax=Alterirhizorhabdus profundi TaxID=2681549 RepID=UPI0018D0446E|nr:HAD family hydrolase [Sphingomonas profundi]
MNGAVFFDRDGVLNEDVGYLHRIADFRWMPGARAALARVRAAGLLAIVVTNQSGVARGLYGEADVDRLHGWMQADLARDGIAITAFYACPFHADAVEPRYRIADHPDRKPNPGMILRAMAEWRIDPARAVMIGDRPSDLVAAAGAGIAAALFDGVDLEESVAPWIARLTAG